jgi:hypothetical protein
LACAERKECFKILLTSEPKPNNVGGIAGNYKRKGRGAAFFSHNANSVQAVLKNEILQEEPVDVECDPTINNSNAAVVGILSCGMGKYCVESSDYDLGGVCVDSNFDTEDDFQRQLPDDGYYASVFFNIATNPRPTMESSSVIAMSSTLLVELAPSDV